MLFSVKSLFYIPTRIKTICNSCSEFEFIYPCMSTKLKKLYFTMPASDYQCSLTTLYCLYPVNKKYKLYKKRPIKNNKAHSAKLNINLH